MQDRIFDAFEVIKADEKIKSSTRDAVRREREKSQTENRQPGKSRGAGGYAGKVLAVCAALCLLLGAGGYYGFSVYPVSFVSIDVNPSIELGLNYRDRVVRAESFNEEGEAVLRSVAVKGREIGEALELIVESAVMKAYLTDSADLTFTIAADNAVREEKVVQAVNQCASRHGQHVTSCNASVATVDQAHSHHLSFGKYAAYLELYKYDNTVTADECRNMTMSEIRSLINRHENGHENEDETGHKTKNEIGHEIETEHIYEYENEHENEYEYGYATGDTSQSPEEDVDQSAGDSAGQTEKNGGNSGYQSGKGHHGKGHHGN